LRSTPQPQHFIFAAPMPHTIKNLYTGSVSRTALLTTFLPLSYVVFFGSMMAAAAVFPGGYVWSKDVISILISPRRNPEGYWLPACGLAVTVLLVWPIGGYVGQRLRPIAPRLARGAGLGISLSFFMLLLSLLAQHIQPLLGVKWLHELTARAAAAIFAFGLVCCIAATVKDRLRSLGGQRSLGNSLTLSWTLLTLLPIVCPVVIGVLVLLAKHADQAWAENLRQSFRHTPLWHLAFWEWIGTCNIFAFLTVSVLFLPRAAAAQMPQLDPRPVTGGKSEEPFPREGTEDAG
jgi:hypothetical protein